MRTAFQTLALLLGAMLLTTGCTISLLPSLNLTTSKFDSDTLEGVVAANRENDHAWFLLGRERLDQEQHRQARRAFRRAVEIRPDFEEAHLGIGISYLNDSRWSRARGAFEEVLEFNPTSIEALGGIAEAYLGERDLTNAELTANRAVRIDPRAGTANRVLGDIRYINGEYAVALEHWGIAMEQGAGSPWLPSLMEDLAQFLEKYD